jgi:hypothetical protein
MPTASSSPPSLSDAQIDQLRADLADGRQPAVWFTLAAVGVEAGRSAKVVALSEPAEGDFIQVRPTGSHDELSFSPSELTMEKPPRRRKVAPEAAAPVAPVKAPVTDELLVVREKPTRKPRPSTAQPTAIPPAPTVRSGRGKPPSPVTVTLTSTPDGEWAVDVMTGSKRAVRAQSVPAASVASAARALGGDIEQAIEGALAAARSQQLAKVAQLEAELEVARLALAELTE